MHSCTELLREKPDFCVELQLESTAYAEGGGDSLSLWSPDYMRGFVFVCFFLLFSVLLRVPRFSSESVDA